VGRLTLITGGARAGKTRFALTLAREHPGPVTYLATAEAGDAEMAARISRHRAERPAHWSTIEAPLDPVVALFTHPRHGLVLLDCLTLWTSNLLLDALPRGEFTTAEGEAALWTAVEAVGRLLDWQSDMGVDLVAVTNEVGLGVVPETALGRLYRDALGRVNQVVARRADAVYLVVSGLAVDLRSLGAQSVEGER
jgi:adenosylcobinamide kinase / adenosylcobinamide-phosphate guanylyltransferase